MMGNFTSFSSILGITSLFSLSLCWSALEAISGLLKMSDFTQATVKSRKIARLQGIERFLMSSSAAAAPSFVFPVLEDEKDFIITSFLNEEALDGVKGEDVEFDLPFGNVPKGEQRIGRIADWIGLNAEAGQQRGSRRAAAAVTYTQSKVEEEDEGWSLSLGNTNPLAGLTRRPAAPKTIRAPTMTGSGVRQTSSFKDSRYGPSGRRQGWSNRPSDRIIREPSIKVGQDWKLIEEVEFSRLAKVQINVEEPKIISTHGSVHFYDRSYDKLRSKAEKPFGPESETIHATQSASEDPVLKKIGENEKATIYATEIVASLLMACQRTVQPWDIVVKRREKAVFFDVRPGSKIDRVNVHETGYSEEVPADSINSPAQLAEESTKINQALPGLLGKNQPQVKFEGESASASAYRYSKFNLGDELAMVVRAEVSNALSSESDLALCKAFLESSPGGPMDWRQKLESSRGGVLANEMKNNAAMLARWVYQAIIADCTNLKLAYVSRVSPKTPQRHVILGVHDFDPYDLASQMSLNIPNGFGIIRAIAELFLALPEDVDYALVRDANKPILRIYSLPSQSA